VSSDDAAVSAAAISRWNRALRGMSEPDQALDHLRTLTIDGRPYCSVARPHLMTRVRYEAERLAVTLVASALSKVSAAIARDQSLLDRLDATAAERDLLTIDPGFTDLDVTDRYDGFVGKRLGFVELQGAAPGGIGMVDTASRGFMQTAAFHDVGTEFELEPFFVIDRLREALLETWRDWGGAGDPTIAIVDWDDAPLMPEFEAIRDSLVEHGLRALIVDPRKLRFENGRLRTGDEAIDLVYRRLLMRDTLARPEDTVALVDAARAGAVCVVNPFANDVMDHKNVFGLLTDPDLDLGLTSAERNAVRNHVPWTRRLTENGATETDTSVSAEYVIQHRESLVIKPVFDYAGHGVHLGWEYDDRDWALVVHQALAQEYVVQKRIWAHQEHFPRNEPGFPLERFYVDTDPYVFRRRMGGVLVRLSRDGITNVSAGGSLVPTFLVSPK
jgi:A circularly permuted ATPgrasp